MSGLSHVSTHDLIAEAETRGFLVVPSDISLAVAKLVEQMKLQWDVNTGFQESFDLGSEYLSAALDRIARLEAIVDPCDHDGLTADECPACGLNAN